MSNSLPSKQFELWRSEFGELDFFRADRALEMHRETCHHDQCWPVLKGSWPESSAGRKRVVRPGQFRTYRPLEQKVRIAEK